MTKSGFLTILVLVMAQVSARMALATEAKPHDWDGYRDVTGMSVNLDQHSPRPGGDGRPEDWGLPVIDANQVYGKPDDWGLALIVQGKPEDWDSPVFSLYSVLYRIGFLITRE